MARVPAASRTPVTIAGNTQMALRLKKLVDDGSEYWYYHKKTGLVLQNHPEYGWVAANDREDLITQYEELQEVIEQTNGDFASPGDVLPLPDNYPV
jgi:hypothetical protein